MAIDINNLTSTQSGSAKSRSNPLADAAKSSGQNDKTPEGSAATSSTDESVSLSNQAQTLSKLESQIKQLPDVDAEKVERIKQAIQNGEFEINADRLASKISQLESGLDI